VHELSSNTAQQRRNQWTTTGLPRAGIQKPHLASPAIASPSAQKRDTSRNRSAFSAACSSSASASSASVRWPRLTGGSPTAFCSFRSKSSRVGDGEGRLRMSGRLPVASSSWKGLLARNSARTPARGGLLVRQRKQSSPSSMPTGRKATPTKTSTTPRETRRWRRLRRSQWPEPPLSLGSKQ